MMREAGLGTRVQDLGVRGLLGIRVQGLGIWVQGLGVRELGV